MLRTVITILICATFIQLGWVGEELRNHFNYSFKEEALPGPTIICMKAFPINSGHFLESTLPFCTATIVILLLTFQTPPLIKRERFADCMILVCSFFALYYGLFVFALIAPEHLLMAAKDSTPTPINIFFTASNYILCVVALALVGRIVLKRVVGKEKLKKTTV